MTADDVLVVVDGAVDTPRSEGARLEVVDGQVYFGEVPFHGGRELLWEMLRKGTYPSTIPPTVSELTAAYERAPHVVGVHVSSALSATVARAKEAAVRGEAHCANRVTVVDTRSLSVGSGLVAVALLDAVDRPRTDRPRTDRPRTDRSPTDAAAIARTARRLPDQLHTFALVQEVDALRASGRAGLLPPERLLRHRPLLLAVRGRAVALEQCRDRRSAVERLSVHLRHSLGTVSGPGRQVTWALGHGDAADIAAVTARLAGLLGCPPRFVLPVDPTVAVHVGPEALIVASLVEDGFR